MISEERLRELWHEVSGMPLMHSTRELARAVEAEAYEAAARVCEKHTFRSGGIVDECAAAIRQLKETS